jgi:hypothetical protein
MQFKGKQQDYNFKEKDRFMMIDEGKVMSYVRRMKVCILEGY